MRRRAAWIVFAACAVTYLVVLPSLPDADGTAENVAWAISVVVALTGLVALFVAVREALHRRRAH